jgi:hypothetical protein
MVAFRRSASEQAMQRASEGAKDTGERVLEVFRAMPSATYLGALALSIAASIALMIGGRERGKLWSIFVGLWAPTILNLGLYSRLRRT